MTTYFEYRVKNCDTLSGIVFNMFGYTMRDQRYKEIVAYIMLLNPQLKTPNRIIRGDILRLGIIPVEKTSVASRPIVKPVSKPVVKLSPSKPPITNIVAPHNTDNFWALSWLEENANFLTIPGGVALGTVGNVMSNGNKALLANVGDIFAEYKAGKLTKGQYDYRRIKILSQLKNNIGPMEKLLFGSKTTRESVRIARGGGVPATAHIAKHIDKINKLASVSKVGGVALMGVGITANCMQIASTTNIQEKNEIFVETVASTAFGTGASIMVGLFLVSNPVGWGTALIFATGTAAAGYIAGKSVRYAYDTFGNQVDLVSGLGVNKVCK